MVLISCPSPPRILVVDDDPEFSSDIQSCLDGRFVVSVAHDGGAAIERSLEARPDIVLLDIALGSEPDGFAVLERLRALDGAPLVIMLTADRKIETVVRAMKAGAFHYVCKPPSAADLINLIHQALMQLALRRKVEALQDEVGRLRGGLVAEDPLMKAVLREAARVAPTEATVLITGETGTGKEMIARRIHELSARAEGPFEAVNCAGFTESLLESELFGHEAGAFTGASRRRQGRIELARGGTLLLDEIGDGPLKLQGDLLRVLEERRFYRVGGERMVEADVRVIAATSRELDREIAGGRFRADLFHRLNVFPIRVPPLRERRGDILPLARHFLARFARESGRRACAFAPEVEQFLLEQEWPGNVRDLRSAVERAVIRCGGETVTLADVVIGTGGVTVPPPPYEVALERVLPDFQRRYIVSLMVAADGRMDRAAEISGLSRQHVLRLLKKYGLSRGDYRPEAGSAQA